MTDPKNKLAVGIRACMEDQGLRHEDQTFDNQPLEIVEAFPDRDDLQLTQEFLERRVWWWRKAEGEERSTVFRRDDLPEWTEIPYLIYRDRFLISAFRYELLARCLEEPDYPFGCPLIRCSREQRDMLGYLWPNDWPSRHWLPTDKGNVEWVKLDLNFNLALNTSVLVEQFEQEIARQRQTRGIEAPKPGRGVPRKEPPWLSIELMDRHYFLKEKLNGSQRSQVSKARRSCEEFCREAGLT